MKVLVLVFLLQAANNLPSVDVIGGQARKVSQIYWDCVIERAVRFENSGDSASDVAGAALTVCNTLDVELEAEIVVHQLGKALGGSKVPDNARISATVEKIMLEFRAVLLERARLQVIELRTRRALGEPSFQ